MASNCKCIEFIFKCSASTDVSIYMTYLGTVDVTSDTYYYGEYDGQTFGLRYNGGSTWEFFDNDYPNSVIVYATSIQEKVCDVDESDWIIDDLTHFSGYCFQNAFETPAIQIIGLNDTNSNCNFFSGDCSCKEITFEKGNIFYQNCDGITIQDYSNDLKTFIACTKGDPIFFGLESSFVEYTESNCSEYCNTGNSCCINITASTETMTFYVDDLTPAGVISGLPYYVFFLSSIQYTIYFDENDGYWHLVINSSTPPNKSIYIYGSRTPSPCPSSSDWELDEPSGIYQFLTHITDCPVIPTPTPTQTPTLTPTPTMTLTPQPYIPDIPNCLKGTNECNVITIFEMDVFCNVVNPTTSTSSNGSAFLTITGGTPPYSITWNNSNVGPAIYNLSGGIYEATVVDYYGDFTAKTKCIVVGPTPTPTLTPTPTPSTPVILYNLCVCVANQSNETVYSDKFEQAGTLNGKPYWSSSTTTSQIVWSSGDWYITIPTNFGFTTAVITSTTTSVPPISGWQVLGQLGFVSISIGVDDCDSNTNNCFDYLKFTEAVGAGDNPITTTTTTLPPNYLAISVNRQSSIAPFSGNIWYYIEPNPGFTVPANYTQPYPPSLTWTKWTPNLNFPLCNQVVTVNYIPLPSSGIYNIYLQVRDLSNTVIYKIYGGSTSSNPTDPCYTPTLDLYTQVINGVGSIYNYRLVIGAPLNQVAAPTT